MDIKKYEILLRVLECGTFSKAAQELDYTQSAISHMIKGLEEYLEFPVLVRKHSGVELTKNGEDLLPYILDLVKANESLNGQISSLNGLRSGCITIGIFTSVFIHVLVPVIREFHKAYPHVEINTTKGTTDDLERMLQENRLDIGFFCDVDNSAAYDKFFVHTDQMMAIVPHDHPYAKLKTFPYKKFEDHHFIMPSPDGDCEARDLITMAGIRPEKPFYVADMHAAINMVESGMGFSLMPELVLEAFHSDVARIPLDPEHHHDIFMHTRRKLSLSPAARVFTQFCYKMLPHNALDALPDITGQKAMKKKSRAISG